jgi:hypothetical protein
MAFDWGDARDGAGYREVEAVVILHRQTRSVFT